MKNAVPGTSKISKEAKDAVQECVSEFISFITSEAAEKCHEEKRKTIGGEDVLYAMMMLGFEQYVEPLKIYLSKMRQVRPPVVVFFPLLFSFSPRPLCLYSGAACPNAVGGEILKSHRNSPLEATHLDWVMGGWEGMRKWRRL